MKRILLLLCFFTLWAHISWGQAIFDNPITGTNPNTDNPYTTGQTVNANITVSGIGRGTGVTGTNSNNRYNANGWNSSSFNTDDYFTFTLTPNSGFEIDFVSFVYTGQASGTGPNSIVFRSSVDGFTSNIGSPTIGGTTISLGAASFQNITTSIEFRVYAWGASSSGGTFSINDFTFNGTVTPIAATPTLTPTPANLTGFSYVVGSGPSTSQNFSLTASSLTPAAGNITVAAPANYEVSLDNSTFSTTSVTIPYTGGALSATTVYVRLRAGLSVGTYNGQNVAISGGGATTANVTCDGEVTTVPVPGCLTDLIISEYGEGSSGNSKYIEIYNGTGSTVNLANYRIWTISNGGSWPESTYDFTTPTLADGATIVIANNASDVPGANEYTGVANWNGNDAVGLAKNISSVWTLIDAVGTDGADPGTGWDVAGTTNATANNRLTRKTTVTAPNTNWASSAGTNTSNSEWEVVSYTTGSAVAGHTVSCIPPDISLSSPNPAVAAGNVAQGTGNHPIYRFDLAITTASAILNGVTINTAGTYVASDITNLQCWYSTDATFDGTDVLLSTKTTALGSGTHVFPSFTSQTININTTGYIFITADISGSATIGNTISVNAITTANISFVSGNETGTANAGGVQTIVTCSPINATGVTASPANAQVGVSWSLPFCYDEILIVASAGSVGVGTPTGNGSAYTANSVFGSGTALLGGNVVYKGTGTSVTVTSLTNGTNYCFKIFTRKGTTWSSGVQVCATPTATTIFKPGDLAFVGFDAQETGSGSVDGIYIMTMVDITPGASFMYINSRFEAGAAACTRTLRWGGSGDDPNDDPAFISFTWNGATNIPAGTVIKVITNGTASSTSDIFFSAAPSTNRRSDFTLSDNGVGAANISSGDPDQLWLAQGTFTGLGSGNVQLSGTVLYGFSNGVNWIDFSVACSGANAGGTARQSRLHPDIECFNWQSSTRREASYYRTSELHVGTKRALLKEIADVTNWTDGTTVPSGRLSTTFTINASNLEGTWVGDDATNPNDWFTCSNWEGLAVPDENTDVVIPNVTNAPRIDVDGYSVGCASSFTSTKYGGFATVKSLTINGETLEFGNGSTNSGSSADRLDIAEDMIITSTTGGFLDMNAGTSAQDGTINLRGNWDNQLNDAAFDEGNGTINFVGTTAQSITNASGAETFGNIGIDNSTGVDLNTTNALVSGMATFTNGIMRVERTYTSTTYSPRVEFLAGSSVSGASNNSYVSGWVRKIGNTAFTFPVGDEGYYATMAISAPANATDHFTAMYERVSPNPYDITLKDLSLDHVGNCEFWMLNRTNGTASVEVTLSYDNVRSCGITPGQESALRVARWNGSLWANEGNTNTNTGAQTITSSSVASFSPFTLASITIANPLPVELLDFRGYVSAGDALLEWETSTEINNYGFEVEKSLDGRNFTKIGFVPAKTKLSDINTYNLMDNNFVGLSYYRLKQLDNDGTFEYSKIISLDKNSSDVTKIIVYPNPTAQREVKILVGNRRIDLGTIRMSCLTAYGQQVASLEGSVQEVEKLLNQQLQQQANGVYLISIWYNGQLYTTKLIKN